MCNFSTAASIQVRLWFEDDFYAIFFIVIQYLKDYLTGHERENIEGENKSNKNNIIK